MDDACRVSYRAESRKVPEKHQPDREVGDSEWDDQNEERDRDRPEAIASSVSIDLEPGDPGHDCENADKLERPKRVVHAKISVFFIRGRPPRRIPHQKGIQKVLFWKAA